MKNITILVADDEARIRGLLSQFFQKKLGYKVVEAEDGEEALNIFLSGKPKINLVVRCNDA